MLLPQDKTQITNWFLAGKSTGDIAARLGLHRVTIENVLREAIVHLMDFVNEDAAKLAPTADTQEAPTV